jgi:hypothetical protein
MTELFAGNKVSWSNRGEHTDRDSVQVRADFKYVESIVRTRQTKLEMPNPEIEITHRLHPKARFTFFPTKDICERSRCVLPKPIRTVNHPDAAWQSGFPELLLYSGQVLPRRLLQILRVEAFNDVTRKLVKDIEAVVSLTSNMRSAISLGSAYARVQIATIYFRGGVMPVCPTALGFSPLRKYSDFCTTFSNKRLKTTGGMRKTVAIETCLSKTTA